MSKYRIRKYNKRPNDFIGPLRYKPILISDSKGNRLKEHAHIIEDTGYSLEFVCKGGARFLDQYFWLVHNLRRRVATHHYVFLYVWLGTCDLTCKDNTVYTDPQNRRRRRSVIKLRHESDIAAVTYIQTQIQKYLDLVSFFPSVKIVFLKVPYYSIQKYNNYLGNNNCSEFKEQDLALTQIIDLVNDHIQQVNQSFGLASVNFKKDLEFRKNSALSRKPSLDFASYPDGLHPDKELAYCWLKKIVTQIFYNCK